MESPYSSPLASQLVEIHFNFSRSQSFCPVRVSFLFVIHVSLVFFMEIDIDFHQFWDKIVTLSVMVIP